MLIAAHIPEVTAREKPVYIKSKGLKQGSFRRIGSADYRCTPDDLDLLFQLRSGIPYESQVLPDVFWEDIDPEVITAYRRQRAQLDAAASELSLGDEELLISLKRAERRDGQTVPNVAGLLLFG